MKKITILMMLFSGGIFAQIPDIQWQKALGGTASDQALGIAETTDGNYVVVGCADSNDGDVSGNHGSTDIWITKLSPQGTILWKKAFGGSQKDFVEYVAATSDGGFVITGATYSNNGDIPSSPNPPDRNILAAKFNADGNAEWVKNIEGLNGQSIIQTSDGGYLLGGERYSPGVNVSYDALIVKMDSYGNSTWENTYGDIGTTMGDIAWRVKEASDGNYIFGGTTNADVWIAKLDTSGNSIWQKLYGSSGYDDFNDILELPDGSFMVACSSPGADGNKTQSFGGYDAWMLKLDSQGNIIWEKSYGGAWLDRTNAVYPTQQGTFIVGGISNSHNEGDIIGFAGGEDYWVIEINGDGDLLNEHTYGGTKNEYLFSFLKTSTDEYIMAGNAYSNDGDVSGNHSDTQDDYWVVKLSTEALTANLTMAPELAFYPNPAGSNIHTNNIEEGILQVYDCTGKQVLKTYIKQNTANVSNLAPGTYFIQATNKEGVHTAKLLKQ